MRRYWHIAVICIMMLAQTSCAVKVSSNINRGEAYAKLYKESPASILVMPPINNTKNADAKDLFYASISHHIAEAGYYVIPPVMAMDVFKNENAYDEEGLISSSLNKFKECFGADAVVFTIIDRWTKEAAAAYIDVKYVIKSTKTNEVLFERTCSLMLDLIRVSSTGGFAGLLADMLVTSMNVAMTEFLEAARLANMYALEDIPYGKYSPLYLQDKEMMSIDRHVRVSVRR